VVLAVAKSWPEMREFRTLDRPDHQDWIAEGR
jgi:hypothetical protein